MTLLNPIWLWGLSALAVPLAVHFLSRKEGKTIYIGSIRFLAETTTSKFSSIKLNEVALLIIRSLLLILIVLFLSGLLLSADKTSSAKWVLVEKGLNLNDPLSNFLDSLEKEGYQIRSLAEGFPLPQNDTLTQTPDYFKLTEEISQKDVHAIIVASNKFSNFKGKRISKPDNITWISYPIADSSISLTNSTSHSDSLSIAIVYDKNFLSELEILSASLEVIKTIAPEKLILSEIPIEQFKSDSSDWIIWLSEKTLNSNTNILYFKQRPADHLIVQETNARWILTERLNQENAIQKHLVTQLTSMLFSDFINKERIRQDHRIIPDEIIWSSDSTQQSSGIAEAGYSTEKILIMLIVLLFLCERVLSFYRKQ